MFYYTNIIFARLKKRNILKRYYFWGRGDIEDLVTLGAEKAGFGE